MPKSRYSWLEQEKAKERKVEENQLDQMRRQMALIGGDDSFAGRYGTKRIGNTGYGEDGVLQPGNPTAMIGSSQGPVMVHEGEDMNMTPGGQIQVIPANKSLPQSQLAAIEQKTGMPGMASGGTFALPNPLGLPTGATGSRDVAPQVNPATGEAIGTEANIQTTGRVTVGGKGSRNPVQIGGKGATNNPIGAIPNPSQMSFTPQANAAVGGTETTGQMVFNPTQTSGAGMAFNPQVAVNAAPATTDVTAADVTDTTVQPGDAIGTQWGRALNRLERTAEGADPFAAQIRQQEQMRFKGEEQAARGAQAQEAAQTGLTGTEFLTEKAMLGRQIGAQENQLMGTLRGQEQQNALQAAMQLPNLVASRAEFDFAKQVYGDQESVRIATDIQNGMSFEQLKAKYPNLTKADYTRMDGLINGKLKNELRADAFNTTKGYIDQQTSVNPDYISSGAWANDPSMVSNLSSQWQAEGNTAPFDINNTAHRAWAEVQVQSATLTPEEVAINQYRASPSYMNLDEADREDVDALLDAIPMLAVTQGYKLGQNADGTIFITNADGDTVYGERSVNPDGSPGGVTADDAADLVATMADYGITTDAVRAGQYLLENPGSPTPTPEQWRTWDSTTPNTDTIMRYLNGDPTAMMSRTDQDQLGLIMDAQKAVKDGTATPEQEVLANSVPIQVVEWTFDDMVDTTQTSRVYDFSPGGVGTIHRSLHVPMGYYDTGGNQTTATFRPALVTWAEENAGNVVMIDGKPYRLNASDPVVKAEIVKNVGTYSQTFTIDALNLYDPDTDSYVEYTFGSDPALWD